MESKASTPTAVSSLLALSKAYLKTLSLAIFINPRARDLNVKVSLFSPKVFTVFSKLFFSSNIYCGMVKQGVDLYLLSYICSILKKYLLNPV